MTQHGVARARAWQCNAMRCTDACATGEPFDGECTTRQRCNLLMQKQLSQSLFYETDLVYFPRLPRPPSLAACAMAAGQLERNVR